VSRLPLLLADRSPCLRHLVLRELLGRAEDDPEVVELATLRRADRLVAGLLTLQQEDGSWTHAGPTSRPGVLQATAQALARLGFLGFTDTFPPVARGAEALFALQREDGAWPIPHATDEGEGREGYSMIPLQTALPLRALAGCGYATDPRSERAYKWLLAQRLDDGAWPTGVASGVFGRVAGYRRLAHSRWGCRSNTTGALSCLALHPSRRTGPEAQRALDLLLGRETRERHTLGFETARVIGVEPTRGFLTHFARFDTAQVLDLCWRVGASRADPRVDELASYVEGARGAYGLWEYIPGPQASRWVSFDVLRSLRRLGAEGDWVAMEPRTPFRPYPRRIARY
jgi:hypothetical protein